MKSELPYRKTLFTYGECYAQSESAVRVHKFAYEPGIDGLVIFYTRKRGDECLMPWQMCRLPGELSDQIEKTFDIVHLPLALKVSDWTSLHFNRYLEVDRRGGNIKVYWDTAASNHGDALEPLLGLIRGVVEELRQEMDAIDLKTCDDALL